MLPDASSAPSTKLQHSSLHLRAPLGASDLPLVILSHPSHRIELECIFAKGQGLTAKCKFMLGSKNYSQRSSGTRGLLWHDQANGVEMFDPGPRLRKK